MTKGKKTLLVGAGAECSAPFCLPSGKQFTFDTCYYSNDALYEALAEFYRGRLADDKNDSLTKAPYKYQSQFLYTARNPEFKKLADRVVADAQNSELYAQLKQYLVKGDSAAEDDIHLNQDGLDFLFNVLIKRSGDRKSIDALHSIALAGIPDDAYFGIIESYFASLINPRVRNSSFWRLINYYWNAYFAVAGPLIRKVYQGDRLFQQKGLYRFTLSNLRDVVETITVSSLYSPEETAGSYYARFQGMFDKVLTTNYTGLSEALFPGDSSEKKCVYLSGALWQFEHLDSLTTYDLLSEETHEQLGDNDFIFPFLMTQAPVKPIVDAYQIRAYSDALEALNQTGLLVVLGYSFCKSDYHIAALVRDYMQKSDSRLVYLDHGGETDSDKLKSHLRLNQSTASDIQILRTDEDGLNKLRDILKAE